MIVPKTYIGVQSPDMVLLKEPNQETPVLQIYAGEPNSYSFGYFVDKQTGEQKFFVSEHGAYHDDILIEHNWQYERDKFMGRVWLPENIISFYGAYGIPNKNEMKGVLDDLNKGLDEQGVKHPSWENYLIVLYEEYDSHKSGIYKVEHDSNVICMKALNYVKGETPQTSVDADKKRKESDMARDIIKGKEDLQQWLKDSPYADKKYKFAMEEIQKIVSECVERILNRKMLNESKQGLKSQKLHDILKKYNGIRRYGHKAYVTGFGLSELGDENVVGVFSAEKIPNTHKELSEWVRQKGYDVKFGDYVDTIELNQTDENGYRLYLIVIFPNSVAKKYFSTVSDRESNRPVNSYRWKSRDAQDYMFGNPYWKQWDRLSQDNMRDKVRRDYLRENTQEEVDEESKNTNINPTEGQKQAGNYKKGHVRVKGYEIRIENPRGTYRKGKDKKGNEWKVKMPAHYGYFTKTVGKDGDAIDVFIGKDYDFDTVYVVDQNKPNGEFDESKVMFCFKDKETAKETFMKAHDEKWHGFKRITGVSLDFFKEWLYDGRRQRIPFCDYVDVKKNKK